MQTSTIRSSWPADLCQLSSAEPGKMFPTFSDSSNRLSFFLRLSDKTPTSLSLTDYFDSSVLWRRSRTFRPAISNCDKLVRGFLPAVRGHLQTGTARTDQWAEPQTVSAHYDCQTPSSTASSYNSKPCLQTETPRITNTHLLFIIHGIFPSGTLIINYSSAASLMMKIHNRLKICQDQINRSEIK